MSQKLFLLSVFTVCLILRVTSAAGAEATEVVKKEASVKTESASTETLEKKSSIPDVEAQGVTKIENHFHINAAPAATTEKVEKTEKTKEEKEAELKDAAAVLGSKADKEPTKVASIQPMVGITTFPNEKLNVKNTMTFGLILDLPVSSVLSLELEGTFGKFQTKYLSNTVALSHSFNQYSGGMNAKVYLGQGLIRPYVLGGFSGIYYDNMYRDPRVQTSRYSQWVGSAQVGAGAELALATNIGLGARASYLMPVANRPTVRMNGAAIAEGYEDAALMDSGFFRLMGFVRVGF